MTIVFSDVSASTTIASTMEPETYNALLEDMRAAFIPIIKKFGGDVVRIDGDGFIFIFGYPVPFEDAARRAAEAALDIHEAVELIDQKKYSEDMTLRLHTGIHSGVVLLKSGDLTRGKYEIIGDPTNLTARLCDFAAPGEILISDETLGRSKKFFQISQQLALNVPGRTEKLIANKIICRRSAKDEILNPTTTFAGRSRTIERLQEFIEEKRDRPSIMFIKAAAGLGKTRLLGEFSNIISRQGISVHMGLCESDLGSAPFQPLDQISKSIFRSEFGTSFKQITYNKNYPKGVCLNMAAAMSPATQEPSAQAGQLARYLQSLSKLLQALKQPIVVLIIDDWQWVDTASKRVITSLAGEDSPFLKIILASREEDQVFTEMNNARMLELQPLKPREMELTIKSLLPGVEPFTLQRIQHYSGGNPLYLEELCLAAKEVKLEFDNTTSISFLESLICARFSRLPEDLAEIVKACAVVGHVVPEWLLASMLGSSLTVKRLSELREYDFIHPAETGGHFRFKHGVTRDVIYKMISLKERQALHRKVIATLQDHYKALQGQEPHEQLAYHYAQSNQATASIHHSRIAGEIALGASALDKAQAHFKSALNLAENSTLEIGEKLELLQKYGRACVVDPSVDQLEILEKATKTAHNTADPQTIAWSEYWLGFNLYGLGLPYRSLGHFKQSYEAAKVIGNEKLLTQLVANLGQAYASACEYQTAYGYLDQAIKVKQANRSGEHASPGLAYALSSKGFALGEQGRFDEAVWCFDQADLAFGGFEHAAQTSVLNQRAAACLWNGEFDECLRLTGQGKDMSRRMHSRYNYAQSTFMHASIQFYQTGQNEALGKMIEATDWLVFDGIGQNLSFNYGCIAEACAQKGLWDRVRIYAARGLVRGRHGDKSCESQAFRALALTAKHGHCRYQPEYYLNKAYQSAEHRQSVRELENNRYFENRYFGKSHNLNNAANPVLYYIA